MKKILFLFTFLIIFQLFSVKQANAAYTCNATVCSSNSDCGMIYPDCILNPDSIKRCCQVNTSPECTTDDNCPKPVIGDRCSVCNDFSGQCYDNDSLCGDWSVCNNGTCVDPIYETALCHSGASPDEEYEQQCLNSCSGSQYPTPLGKKDCPDSSTCCGTTFTCGPYDAIQGVGHYCDVSCVSPAVSSSQNPYTTCTARIDGKTTCCYKSGATPVPVTNTPVPVTVTPACTIKCDVANKECCGTGTCTYHNIFPPGSTQTPYYSCDPSPTPKPPDCSGCSGTSYYMCRTACDGTYDPAPSLNSACSAGTVCCYIPNSASCQEPEVHDCTIEQMTVSAVVFQDILGNDILGSEEYEPYTDSDGDGRYDSGEPYLDINQNGVRDFYTSVTGVRVDLYKNSGTIISPKWNVISTKFTDQNGVVTWTKTSDSPPVEWSESQYMLVAIKPSGGSISSDTFRLDDSYISDYDCGYDEAFPLAASSIRIEGDVFVDDDKDGIYDTSEAARRWDSVTHKYIVDPVKVALVGNKRLYYKKDGVNIGYLLSGAYGAHTTGPILKYNYTISFSDYPEAYYLTTPESYTKNISFYSADFGLALTSYDITGNVFVDNDRNGIYTAGDTYYNGATLTLGGAGSGTTTTNSSGNYSFLDRAAGSYTVTLTNPNSALYNIVSTNPQSLILGPDATANFYLQPKRTYKGIVFVDKDKDGVKDAEDTDCYSGSVNITVSNSANSTTQAFASQTSCNQYSIPFDDDCTVNPPGASTVSVSAPSGYEVTGWQNVTAGTSGKTAFATPVCANPEAVVNFGISNSYAWIQVPGGDWRDDGGATNPVPVGAAAGACQLITSPDGTGGSPGIVYTGGSSGNIPTGGLSSTEWLVGGTSFPETFNDQIRRKTAYSYIYSKVQEGGLTMTDITVPSDITSSGVYFRDGDLVITSDLTIDGNRDIVLLVNGNLNIQAKTIVAKGSTLTFIVKQNIYVDDLVGEALHTSSTANLQGYFSADQSFIVQDDGKTCAEEGADKRLNIEGAVVVNAGGTGGGFTNTRDLCEGNLECPAFYVKERPDFVLNAPSLLRYVNYKWREIAP